MGQCFREYLKQPKVLVDYKKYVDEKLLLDALDERICEEKKDALSEDERNAYDIVRIIIANW